VEEPQSEFSRTELPEWTKPETAETELREIESVADLDVVFATTTTGCDHL
jgi:hypothetical protein